jgi:hypothetical protein
VPLVAALGGLILCGSNEVHSQPQSPVLPHAASDKDVISKLLLVVNAEGKPRFVSEVAKIFGIEFSKELIPGGRSTNIHRSHPRPELRQTISVNDDNPSMYSLFQIDWTRSPAQIDPSLCVRADNLEYELQSHRLFLSQKLPTGPRDNIGRLTSAYYDYLDASDRRDSKLEVVVSISDTRNNCVSHVSISAPTPVIGAH